MVAMKLGAMGPNYGIVSACATATHALGEALQKIQQGEADVMLAGGCEATLTPLTISGFTSMRAMCTTGNDDPKKASRPFDANRCGFVMGEGAGIMVLESEEHAKARAEVEREFDRFHMRRLLSWLRRGWLKNTSIIFP